jgi:conjugative transfer signal peptidase TraF
MHRGYAAAMVLGFDLIVASAFFPRSNLLIWNASASAPIGLYRLRPDGELPNGTLAVVAPPDKLADWLAARGYLPKDVPLLKHVAAQAGQTVCRTGMTITIDKHMVGEARGFDSQGRPLPVWTGCRTLRPDELFLMNAAVPDSLDGRYFGPLPAETVLGEAVPLLTRDRPDGPLIWRKAKPKPPSCAATRKDN